MIKINLNEYKESKIYFKLLDLIISKNEDNKECFLKSLDINPSTYRRCRQNDFTISEKIIYKISSHYGYKNHNYKIINDAEKLFNNIYFDMYYKIYTRYNNYLEELDIMIKENYLITPIIELFKLFLFISSQKDYDILLSECSDLYDVVKSNIKFYNESLMKIYELIYLSLEPKIDESKLLKSYDDGSAYYILSYRNLLKNKYLESLYYGEKSKKILLEEGNIFRMILQNNTIITCYMNVHNYEDSLKILKIQSKILEAIESSNKTLVKKTKRAYIVCMLALNKYEELIDYLKYDNEFTFTTIGSYLIALYNIDKEEYDKYKKTILAEIEDNKTIEFIEIIDLYIKTKNRKSLEQISKFSLNEQFLEVLKNKIKI